ncbi:MAG: hypothetical protein GY938_31695 [Ketobacter sp.]|nr:hypothetical protein [Ketobacter sp.]
MAIGAGWVNGSWVDAGWQSGSWAGVDVTAPVLSLPTGTQTGATTATGTVTTDETGTLYYWATTSPSETAGNIQTNGASQPVTATGLQNVSVTGLTAETSYYLHYVELDASSNVSNVESSAAFTTTEVDDTATAGWIYRWKVEQDRRIEEDKARRKAKKKAKKIKKKIDRELALAEREIEEEAARKAELARINRLASDYQSELKALNPKIEKALTESLRKQTFSTMERLERELGYIYEEEQFLIMATQILVNQ